MKLTAPQISNPSHQAPTQRVSLGFMLMASIKQTGKEIRYHAEQLNCLCVSLHVLFKYQNRGIYISHEELKCSLCQISPRMPSIRHAIVSIWTLGGISVLQSSSTFCGDKWQQETPSPLEENLPFSISSFPLSSILKLNSFSLMLLRFSLGLETWVWFEQGNEVSSESLVHAF